MAKDKKSVVSKSDKDSGKMRRYESPFDEMERMMEQMFNRGGWMTPFPFFRSGWPEMKSPFEGRAPKVDVVDRETEVFVKAELPGVEKDDLEVTLSDNSLTIRATTKHEEEKEEGEYHHKELSSGEFVRTLTLPAEVEGDKAQASFKNGVLELTLPKKETTKRQTVKID